MDAHELAKRLGAAPPLDSLDADELKSAAAAAEVQGFAAGVVVLDAFAEPTSEVYVVLAGRVDLWNSLDRVGEDPDESLSEGGVFGFSAMLTERSVGPRAVAVTDVTVARLPSSAVTPAFVSRTGARFLAERVTSARRGPSAAPSYSLVDDLIVSRPLVVDTATPVGEVARRMTETDTSYAVVRSQRDGQLGLVTDALLRRHVIVDGRAASTPAGEVMDPAPATCALGDSAAEALILLLDRGAEFVLVTDRSGSLRGVVEPRDFAVSSVSAGVSLHEQVRRASTLEELERRGRRVPGTLGDLLGRGLATSKVVAVSSAIVDALVRRAITLVFEQHPELSTDRFTWLLLGSNGRREPGLSSDVDTAVAFSDTTPAEEVPDYRAAFAKVSDVLARAGISSDDHGTSAHRPLFSRTNAEWRTAGEQWLAAPADNNGAMMTSLLVDGRPIHGDPGLPAVTRVFGDLRRHPGTMRLLLKESLAYRARLRSVKEVLTGRTGSFDIKSHALLPIVNIARWAALSAGSPVLPTIERIRSAAGSAILPEDRADTLVEVFEVLQRLRLRYQMNEHRSGAPPSDVLVLEQLSAIDRAVISQAVREISVIQRRMANVSAFVPPGEWSSPDQSA